MSFLPADDPQSTPDQDVEAAIAGALAPPPAATPVVEPPPLPFGRSWVFDFEAGQFVCPGTSPLDARGFQALEQWCLMAIHSARYAHPVFSDAFGMDEPDSIIGEFAIGEALADWQTALVDALMVHDRISSVENFDMVWDPSEGVLVINTFDIVTDEDETLTISDVGLQAGAAGQ